MAAESSMDGGRVEYRRETKDQEVTEELTMSFKAVSVEAVFENGRLRPLKPIPLTQSQRVQIIVQVPAKKRTWPKDVAAVYQEIEEKDCRFGVHSA